MHQPHPTDQELSAHQRRELSAGETLAVSDHLSTCAECREAFGRLRSPKPAAEPVEDNFPGADYETLCAYLDGKLEPVEQEILEADLQNYPSLAAQLADLRRCRREAAARSVQAVNPAQPPANMLPFPARRQTKAAAWWALAAVVALSIGGVAAWRWTTIPEAGGGRGAVANQNTASATRDEPAADALLADGAIPAEWREATRAVLGGGPLPVSEKVRSLRGEHGALLDEPSSGKPADEPHRNLVLRGPVGLVVRETQPTLRWTVPSGVAASRVVLVRLEDGAVQRSSNLPPSTQGDGTLTWTPAEPLSRGKVYEWQAQTLDAAGNVLERRPSPPEPGAQFQVLDATSLAALTKLEAAHPETQLLLATVCARLGLLAEVEAHLRSLATENPASPLAPRLLRDLDRQESFPPAPSSKN